MTNKTKQEAKKPFQCEKMNKAFMDVFKGSVEAKPIVKPLPKLY